MIDLLGFLYGLSKDIIGYLDFEEGVKLVDREWLEKSGFKDGLEELGYELYWSKSQKIPSREFDGWEVVYEIDKLKKLRNRIEWVSSSGNESLVLLGRKCKENT